MSDPAIVVFSDHTDIWWLKVLHRGFRHCSVLIQKNGIWICVDPLAHRTEINVIDVPDGFNLAEWLEGDNCTVVLTHTCRAEARPLLAMPTTCVEAVKRLLGIRAAFVLTPWQLHRYLKKEF